MKKIIEYDIISGDSSFDVIFKMKIAIESGWQPTGGLCCDVDFDFYQAVVKYEEKE